MRRISTGSPFEAVMGYNRAVVAGPWCFVSGVTGDYYATMSLPEEVVPQAATMIVAGLIRCETKIEIEVTALKP